MVIKFTSHPDVVEDMIVISRYLLTEFQSVPAVYTERLIALIDLPYVGVEDESIRAKPFDGFPVEAFVVLVALHGVLVEAIFWRTLESCVCEQTMGVLNFDLT